MASSARKSKGGDYKYTVLSDVRNGELVNVYGVVKSFKKPFTAITGDKTMTIGLIDPSLHSPNTDNFLMCVLFSDTLPNIKSVGDVVRLHRLRVEMFNGRLQVKGNKSTGFSWVVVHGIKGKHPNEDFDLEYSHGNFNFSEGGYQKVRQLFEWTKSLDEVNGARAITLLKELKPDNKFKNLIGQVVSVHPSPSGDSCVIVRVWDGSKPDYQSYRYSKLHPAKDEPCLDLQHQSEERFIEIFAYDNHVEKAASLKPGDFIFVSNIHEKRVDDTMLQFAVEKRYLSQQSVEENKDWIGFILHTGTSYGRGIEVLDRSDPALRDTQSRIEAVIEEKNAQAQRQLQEAGEKEAPMQESDLPPDDEMEQLNAELTQCHEQSQREGNEAEVRAMQESCTLALHHQIEFTTIAGISSSTRVPYKFRCRAQVFYYEPKRVDEIIKVCCNTCGIKVQLKYILQDFTKRKVEHPQCSTCRNEFTFHYTLKILLGDDTGILGVLIAGDDAKMFFEEFPVELTRVGEETRGDLNTILTGLLFDFEKTTGPYFECCIKSFPVTSPKTKESQTLYRVFDTKLYR